MDEPLFPACGYVQHEGVMVTKHDFGINSRKNAKKMLNLLPLDVNTGDAGGFTFNMPNKVSCFCSQVFFAGRRTLYHNEMLRFVV